MAAEPAAMLASGQRLVVPPFEQWWVPLWPSMLAVSSVPGWPLVTAVP